MAYFIENFGLDYSEDTFKCVQSLMMDSAQNGTVFVGYSGNLYFRHNYGDFELFVTARNNEEKVIKLENVDTHCPGNAVWDVCISEMGVDYNDDPMRKRIAVKSKEDGKGLCVVDVMCSDILPSYMPGEEIIMQVIGFPLQIDYLESEDEYREMMPKNKFGNTFGLEDGTIFPLGIFINGNPDKEQDNEEEVWSHTVLRGTVKCFRECYVQFGDAKWNLVRALIDTKFGELEIVHTYDQVKEEQRKNLKKGAIVTGVFEISGDPAVYQYEKGMVKDEENHLRTLRQAFCKGDAQRLKLILADTVVYIAGDGKEYEGKESIIKRINDVHEIRKNNNLETYTWMATLEEEKPGDPLPYTCGKRCFIVSYNESRTPEAVTFIELNEENLISKIVVSTESRYVFRKDKPLGEVILSDVIKLPETFVDSILARAAYHNLISFEEREKLFSEDIETDYITDAKLMYKAVKEAGFDDEVYKYMFGYMFAKSVEKRISKSGHLGYYPEDVFKRKFTSDLSDEWDEKIQIAIDLGSQFYRDFCNFHPKESNEDATYEKDMINALILVQKLGSQFMIENL